MKNILVLLLFLPLSNLLYAQDSASRIPVSISYFSFLGYQPGAKVGTQFELKSWETTSVKYTNAKSIFLSPQVAFYTYPNVHTSYIANVDFGYKRVKSHNQKYSAWSFGLGYMNESRITEWRLRLSDGNKEKVRKNVSWFLPSLNYEFGKAVNERIICYSKFSYGMKIAQAGKSSSILFVELGIKLHLFELK